MRRPFRIRITSERPATAQEQMTLNTDVVRESATVRVQGYDRTDAAANAKGVAEKKWPKKDGWNNHSAVAA